MTSAIDRAIGEGSKLHAFRSGGGLRVLTLSETKDHPRGGYGEHPSIEDALRIAGEDFDAGGREYAEVYGKTETHYLTGSSTPSSELDKWVLAGHTVDAFSVDGFYVDVELHGYARQEMPEWIERVALKEPVLWLARGYKFRSAPTRFPNGDPAVTTSAVARPDDDADARRAFSYPVIKRGRGATFAEAVEFALAAEPVEVRAA